MTSGRVTGHLATSRRSFISTATLGTGALLFNGCWKKRLNEINVLYFRGLAEGLHLQANIAEFERQTGNKVHYSDAPYDDIRSLQLKSFGQHHAEYDVIFVDDIWMYEYARRGYIRELTDLVAKDHYNMGDINPKVNAAEAYLDGRIWLIPQRADVQVLFYNKKILNDNEVRSRYKSQTGQELTAPETWEQYHEVARAAHGIQRNGIRWFGTAETFKQPHFAFEFFATRYWSISGLDFFDSSTGRPIFNNPGGVEALRFLCSLADVWTPGSILAGHDESISAFSKGNVALMPQWYAFYATLNGKESPIREDLGVALMPGHRTLDSGIRRAPSIGGGSLGISANSSKVEAAWEFIEFMTSQKFMHDAALAGEIVTRISAYGDPVVKQRFPSVDIYLRSVDISKFRPRSVSYASIEAAIGNGVSTALAGDDPYHALTGAVNAVESIDKGVGA